MAEISKAVGVQGVAIPAEAAGHKLKSGTLTMPEVLAQSVANMAPSAAMALLPLLVFYSAGNGTWVSFLIAVLLMASVGYCAAQFGRRMNSAGSFYVWVSRALGPAFGHAAGWGLMLGYVATGVATVYGFGIFGGDLLSRLGLPGDNAWLLGILFVVDFAFATAVAVLDMGLSARTSLILEGLSITIILILCVATWVHQGGIVDADQLSLKGVTASGVTVGVVLGIFAFVGFESAGSLGVESKDAFRNVPRAIIWSCIVVGIFYLVVSYSQVFGFQGATAKDASGNAVAGLAVSGTPLPDLASRSGVGALAYAIDLGIVCSMFACTLACINAGARVLYAMTHDGMSPVRAIGNVHRSRRTPHVAIGVVAILMVLIPLATQVAHISPVDATGGAGTLAVFGFLLGYLLVAIGAPIFLMRSGVRSPLTWVLGMVGAVVMVFVYWANILPQTIPGGVFPALTSFVIQVLPIYVFVAWVILGVLYYFVWRARNPEKAKNVGLNYHTPEEAKA